MSPAPMYGEDVNADIAGEPFPPHRYVPPLPGAQGSCAFVWRDRPCTLDGDAGLHNMLDHIEQVIRTSKTAAALRPLFDEAISLAVAKDAAYAGAWRRQGYMGNVARVLSKVERLRELVWSDNTDFAGGQAGEETVEDTLLDLVNIAGFALANLRAQNRWGDR